MGQGCRLELTLPYLLPHGEETEHSRSLGTRPLAEEGVLPGPGRQGAESCPSSRGPGAAGPLPRDTADQRQAAPHPAPLQPHCLCLEPFSCHWGHSPRWPRVKEGEPGLPATVCLLKKSRHSRQQPADSDTKSPSIKNLISRGAAGSPESLMRGPDAPSIWGRAGPSRPYRRLNQPSNQASRGRHRAHTQRGSCWGKTHPLLQGTRSGRSHTSVATPWRHQGESRTRGVRRPPANTRQSRVGHPLPPQPEFMPRNPDGCPGAGGDRAEVAERHRDAAAAEWGREPLAQAQGGSPVSQLPGPSDAGYAFLCRRALFVEMCKALTGRPNFITPFCLSLFINTLKESSSTYL